jgi:predicted porin
MKKTQIALAAFALVASTVAMAEVKLSGVIDASVASTTKMGTYLEQGAWTSVSSITFSASEDLGGGLKAFTNLEAGFGLNGSSANGGNDASASPGALFSRQANVGLSGDFGSITAGLQLSPFIAAAAGSTSGVGNFFVQRIIMGSSAAGCSANCNVQAGGFFIRNAITYTTPSVMGFTGTLMGNTNGGVDQTGGSGLITQNGTQDKYMAGSITGAVGAGTLNIAFDDRKNQDSHWLVGGTYPIAGALTLSGSIMNRKVDNVSGSIGSYNLGGSYALTEATSLILQYAAADKGKNSATNDSSLWNIAVGHTLSKSTSVYATYTKGEYAPSALGGRGVASLYSASSNSTFAVGMVKSF